MRPCPFCGNGETPGDLQGVNIIEQERTAGAFGLPAEPHKIYYVYFRTPGKRRDSHRGAGAAVCYRFVEQARAIVKITFFGILARCRS